MQKLVWQNANGDTIDLTSGSYGITEWEGFSNASLNIQSQQVPFQDGAVFLDALIEPRELSVTLAMQDNNDLELRYQLRRELIHKLNPKLGEGYLIYTNDFISKRIKCVAQIPLFETHNSNDSGTPKASLSWVANEPYWEDLEETVVAITSGKRTTVVNNGDTSCGLIIDMYTIDVENPQIKNITENKLIKLNGNFNKNITINTNVGKKTINEKSIYLNISQLNISLRSITYSESLGIFIVVGNNGTILKSNDGINWTFINNYINQNLISVKYINNLFVIVGGNGIILTSPDGINWTSRTSGSYRQLNDVTYSESLGIFVVVGNNGTILTSPDGINWTSRTSGISVALRVAFCDNDLFLIVGGETNNGYILKSNDGINWNVQLNYNKDLNDITYSESLGIFVVVGNNGTILTSPDGINWTSRTSGTSTGLNDITYSENLGMFVIAGNSGIILTSFNGINWTSRTSGTSTGLSSITYSENLGIFVIVGGNGIILTSPDGINWNLIIETLSQYKLNSVKYFSELNEFLIVGSNGYILKSNDGINWVSENKPAYLTDVIYIDKKNLYIITSNNGKILKSNDGINWDFQELEFGNYEYFSITYSEKIDLIVLVGDFGRIFTSPDGINWTSRNANANGNLMKIIYVDSLEIFMIVGERTSNEGQIYISSDGINWTFIHSGVLQDFKSVTYSKSLEMFVIVGNEGLIIVSRDYEKWDISNSGVNENLNSVIYSEVLGIFIVVGNNGTILKSNDGINWTNVSISTTYALTDVYYSVEKEKIVIVGENGIVLYSQFEILESLIEKITPDSDMSMSLKIGENELLMSRSLGTLNGKIMYRQKYIGV